MDGRLLRRLMLAGALLVALGAYARYRVLVHRANMVPRIQVALGRAQAVGSSLENFRKFYIRQHLSTWESGCKRLAERGEGDESPGLPYYRQTLQTTIDSIDHATTAKTWPSLGSGADAARERLIALRNVLATEAARDDAMSCDDQNVPARLEWLGETFRVHGECLQGFLELAEANSLDTKGFATCLAEAEPTLARPAAAPVLAREAPARSPAFEETVVALGQVRGGDVLETLHRDEGRTATYVVSPDGTRVAWVAERGGRQLVVVDGQEGPVYDRVWLGFADGAPGGPRFSPDSRHLVYQAQRGGRWSVVIDGQEGPWWDAVDGLTYTGTDTGRLVFVARNDGVWRAVVDGEELPGRPVLLKRIASSADGRHLAYVVGSKPMTVLVDGQPGPQLDQVLEPGPVLSPNGERVAYTARHQGRAVVVVDDRIQPSDDGDVVAPGPVFSADSRRVGWTAERGRQRVVVVDGAAGAAFDEVAPGSPVFAPAGPRVAWAGRRAGHAFAVIDGRELGPFEAIRGNVVFAPDGAHTAFLAHRGRRAVVVVDGQEGTPYGDVRSPLRFGPRGGHLAYVAREGRQAFVVQDGIEHTGYRDVADASLCWSDDGTHLAYVAWKDGWRLVIDRRETTSRLPGLVPDVGPRFAGGGVHLLGLAVSGVDPVRIDVALPAAGALHAARDPLP